MWYKSRTEYFRYALSICEDDLETTRDLLQSPTARTGQLGPCGSPFSHMASPAYLSLVAPWLPEKTTLVKLGVVWVWAVAVLLQNFSHRAGSP